MGLLRLVGCSPCHAAVADLLPDSASDLSSPHTQFWFRSELSPHLILVQICSPHAQFWFRSQPSCWDRGCSVREGPHLPPDPSLGVTPCSLSCLHPKGLAEQPCAGKYSLWSCSLGSLALPVRVCREGIVPRGIIKNTGFWSSPGVGFER